MDLVTVGHWTFVLGLILSVIAGFGGEIPALTAVLVVLGLIVGFLNVTEKESTPFLVGVIALMLVGSAGLGVVRYADWLVPILNNIVAFVAAAGLVVAVKQVLSIARSPQA
ncbi:MAG: hypothetical protein G01um101430_744 [Parcubacteria group bacterium Gr01-1014_30]|nr:MAG: hypothetical protein G01um101430_744 [Parcubacteria group bacterium Gr01-1014_30]